MAARTDLDRSLLPDVVEPRTVIGEYVGKCYELCGVYHSRMLFNVKVVSRADYEQHVRDVQADGRVSDTPLIGGADAYTQAGLDSGTPSDGGAE